MFWVKKNYNVSLITKRWYARALVCLRECVRQCAHVFSCELHGRLCINLTIRQPLYQPLCNCRCYLHVSGLSGEQHVGKRHQRGSYLRHDKHVWVGDHGADQVVGASAGNGPVDLSLLQRYGLNPCS